MVDDWGYVEEAEGVLVGMLEVAGWKLQKC